MNRLGERLSDQLAWAAVSRYAAKAGSLIHITPHTFHHAFTTLLLEEGVGLRFIQNLLGRGSIKTAETYTHVLKSCSETYYAGIILAMLRDDTSKSFVRQRISICAYAKEESEASLCSAREFRR